MQDTLCIPRSTQASTMVVIGLHICLLPGIWNFGIGSYTIYDIPKRRHHDGMTSLAWTGIEPTQTHLNLNKRQGSHDGSRLELLMSYVRMMYVLVNVLYIYIYLY
jgi:hypothetical protein